MTPFDLFCPILALCKIPIERPNLAQKSEIFEAFKNFKVGANGSKVGLEILKSPQKVIIKKHRGIDFDQNKIDQK